MKDTLKTIGVFTVTGIMALYGALAGAILFKPGYVTFNNNKSNKESE